VVRLGRGWYLVRWPYRRRYADYLWMPEITRTRKVATWLRGIGRGVIAGIPVGVRRLEP
jgi:hypothetical protein